MLLPFLFFCGLNIAFWYQVWQTEKKVSQKLYNWAQSETVHFARVHLFPNAILFYFCELSVTDTEIVCNSWRERKRCARDLLAFAESGSSAVFYGFFRAKIKLFRERFRCSRINSRSCTFFCALETLIRRKRTLSIFFADKRIEPSNQSTVAERENANKRILQLLFIAVDAFMWPWYRYPALVSKNDVTHGFIPSTYFHIRPLKTKIKSSFWTFQNAPLSFEVLDF